MRSVQPYRTDLWPRWSRRGAALSSAIARQWFQRAPVTGAPLGERLGSLFNGASFEPRFLSVQTREALAKTYAQRPSIFALFTMESGPCCVAVDAPLARWIAAKCAGMDEKDCLRALAPAPFGAVMEGSFALACILAARALCEPGAPPVFRAATDRWEDVDFALPKGECAVWPAFVRVGEHSGAAALIVAASAVRATREPHPSHWPRAEGLSARASLVAARDTLTREELDALRGGSVITLGAPLFKNADGALRGPMVIALGSVECPVVFDGGSVRCDGALRAKRSGSMAQGRDDSVEKSAMNSSSDGTDPAARTALLATVPVEVEIVIARGVFAVGEVAAWRPGEVIALPTRVGEPVEIRAGGRVIARAELVDVDGEVGVRVLDLLG